MARPRRIDDTCEYATSGPEPGLPTDAPSTLEPSGVPVAADAPRESTLLFSTTLPPDEPRLDTSHSTVDEMEEELLRASKLSYRLREHWQRARPRAERALLYARLWSHASARWLGPRVQRALCLALAASRTGLRLARLGSRRLIARYRRARA